MDGNGRPAGPPPRGPERNTGALLFQAYQRLADHINDATRRVDHRVRPAHAAVFVNMEHAGIRLTRLAEKAVMTPQAMGELVDDLEGWGFLRRVPDPVDRRAKLIVFTERGHDALTTAFAVIDGVERKLRALIGAAELARLQAALIRIAEEF
ncbi:MarR family winged helix-turn-helix transcriptional regulator [Actinokineospora iranica]|uniref:DNA-binding transcriptional regulator, MarR family n=1 Tax=Actinokineospora iranica TaxID=1271860 RepID=A0A1G6TKT3_9PSEU|nr:MarR family transcriptional regulator [Actinokineospora iranica]SDD29660.1 DNA-binding transcriptional regulator, MarR family [Actinokineospora iranica]